MRQIDQSKNNKINNNKNKLLLSLCRLAAVAASVFVLSACSSFSASDSDAAVGIGSQENSISASGDSASEAFSDTVDAEGAGTLSDDSGAISGVVRDTTYSGSKDPGSADKDSDPYSKEAGEIDPSELLGKTGVVGYGPDSGHMDEDTQSESVGSAAANDPDQAYEYEKTSVAANAADIIQTQAFIEEITDQSPVKTSDTGIFQTQSASDGNKSTSGQPEQQMSASDSTASGSSDFSAQADASAEDDTVTKETIPQYVSLDSCYIAGTNIVIKGSFTDGINAASAELGNDPNLYLLELEPFEDSIDGHRMIAEVKKDEAIEFAVALNPGTVNDRLYNKFVVCRWDGSSYTVISNEIYITNPEYIAKNKQPYKEPLSKKGLLIELTQLSDAFSLGVCNVIINIPFDTLIGNGIEYVYDGETYHFDKNVVAAYDKTVSMFSNKSMNVTAILLNSYNEHALDLIHPGTEKTSDAMYYDFNASTEDGYKYIKAIASFLADRYSGKNSDQGRIQNWIIGNEINNQHWNYLGPMSLDEYTEEYERSFRVFYNAIRSGSANARVFFSLDNNWNQGNDNRLTYTAKDTLESLANVITEHGNIDWGLAYHPYCVPTVEPEFWDDFATGQVSWSEESKVVNFANLSILTDFMQKEEMLDTDGNVRHIILSEQGFTSESHSRGTVEELQAASFAYAYYIADSNPYIDAFILSRQIDAPSEVKVSLAFGLWTTSSTEDVDIRPDKKKYIWNVFKHIDKQQTTLENTEFAKKIIGIDNWSDVIPDFKWRRQELNGS